MKKIIIVVLAIMLMVCLTSCGGRNDFRRVHIFTHTGQDKCIEIQSCITHPVGVTVYTKEYGALYLSEGTYMLCESECPICGGLTNET